MAEESEEFGNTEQEGRPDQDQQQEGVAQTDSRLPDPFDPSIPDVYANFTHITLGASDLSILFGYLVEGRLFKPSIRVTLTHHSFIQMMDALIQRLIILKRMYGDQPLSVYDLADKNPDEWDKALEEVFRNE